jgi:tRNA-splicing ligase RtcB
MSTFNVDTSTRFPIKMWTKDVPVEDKAKDQLRNLANLPFIYKHIAVMPDVHWGIGATVGSVVATKSAIIPAAVGVDIGCGMIAVKTSLIASDLPDSFGHVRSAIEKSVPHGRTNNGQSGDRGAWHNIPESNIFAYNSNRLNERLATLVTKSENLADIERASKRALNHLGTLGTGNHFVEVCLDENQNVWVMLHSGSRGIGNTIGRCFIELAKKDMKKWFINLPDEDLAYLPEGTENFDLYVEAVMWAQDFARLNRKVMMDNTLSALRAVITKPFQADLEAVNCHHNYVTIENHFNENVLVTRKGAVRARKGDLGIIPGSMGAKSFIVCGKGHPESFCSCSHGAGRKMSRNEAKKTFTLQDHIAATEGVECRKDKDVLDETPAAYKDIDTVMAAQQDLVEIKYTLKQVLCVKG